jgi:DNA repair protein RecO (recombination protein O)
MKTQGIVIAVYPTREADRSYSVLTVTHGKLRLLGRGAQKAKAKLASHLEPFAVVDLDVIRGRRAMTVISVERIQTFPSIAKNLEKRLLVQAIFAFLNRYTQEEDPDEELFTLLHDWLVFIEELEEIRQTRATFLLGGFLLRLLSHGGYSTQLTHCLACKDTILPLSFRWHSGRGGLVCTDCTQTHREDFFSARTIQQEVITMLRLSRDGELLDMLRPALKGAEVESYAQAVHDLVAHHLPGRYEQPFWEAILVHYELAG